MRVKGTRGSRTCGLPRINVCQDIAQGCLLVIGYLCYHIDAQTSKERDGLCRGVGRTADGITVMASLSQ